MKQIPTRFNHNQRYWLLQILGWSSIIFVETVNYTFFIIGEFSWRYVGQFALLAGVGIFVSHFYRKWCISSAVFDRELSRIWVRGIIDVVLISTLMTTVLYFTLVLGQGWETLSKKEFWISYFGQIMNLGRYVMGWVIIYYLYHVMRHTQEVKEQKLRLENLAKSAELELLKNQLNPHFLFNSLNSIKALVLIDQEKARDAIIKLSELLRFSLNYEKAPVIEIQEEIREVEKYLDLEKVRFGNRLDIEILLEEDALELRVPPALILTLAENAIKHGITQLPDGGKISISCEKRKDLVKIEVKNTGELSAQPNAGIGLNNIRKRLTALFGSHASFELISGNPGEVIAKVTYPAA